MPKNAPIVPPKKATRFLRMFCHPLLLEDVEGDLAELYAHRAMERPLFAKFKYYHDVLLLFRPGIIKNIGLNFGLIHTVMIKNYFKIAWRNALRYKGFAALNLLGLVVGLVSSMLILLWVNDEMQMDKFHANGEYIYELFRNRVQGDEILTGTSVPKPAADLLETEFPEVNEVALLSWELDQLISYQNEASKFMGRVASQSFLDIFTFPLLVGDDATALAEMNSIVISRTMAEKYFGSNWKEKALGASLRVSDQYDLFVSGVFDDPGSNSSLKFSWLASVELFISGNPWVNNWGNGSFNVYFTTDSEGNAREIEKRIHQAINENTKDNDLAGNETLIVHKFEDYYLYSTFENGVVAGGRIGYVKIMSVIALLILIVACINFMNLATARSARRSKEVGLRKTMGAHRRGISSQFFLESMLYSFTAVLLSTLVVWLLLPYFNELVGKSLALDFGNQNTWYFLVGVGLGVGLLSGSYPALLLPTFSIIHSMKGVIKQSVVSTFIRKGLVVFQFSIATLLIIGTFVIRKQLDYVLTKDLGLDKDNVLMVAMEGKLGEQSQTFKNELLTIPEVRGVTASSGNPIYYARSTSSAKWEGKTEEHEINVLMVDTDFIEVMGMEMAKGRAFQSGMGDSTNFIINEVAARIMGFEDPLNKDLSFWGIDGKVIGVVKDFHMRDLHEAISPLIITSMKMRSYSLALIRIDGNPANALKEIERITNEMNPQYDFEYSFMDDAYAESYRTEQTISTQATLFSAIAIFISCLGLLGLSSYTAEQRLKEIGIRKVHGASIRSLILLLSKDYSFMILMSLLLAMPLGYYYAQQWLQDFEFRTSLDVLVFVIAGLCTLIVGLVTVSYKSYHAARLNPVESLRNE